MTDATHDPSLKSWVETANDPKCDFAVQNLPFGVFSTAISPIERIGTAIGDQIVDLSVLVDAGLLSGVVNIFDQSSLNAFMAMGPTRWKDIRTRLSALLSGADPALRDNAALCDRAFVAQDDATLHLPIQVTEFTDFYASREHATNVGRMFRDPDKALMPNWLHMPVGYNGRASTVVVSGTDIIRPSGQVRLPDADAPVFQASAKLDIELEMGAIVGTPNAMGSRISPDEAEDMIFGYVLLNDWSARDIQIWEYQPLGPFQAKAFATTISPWVVTSDALAPFQTNGPDQYPAPLPYLRQDGLRNVDLNLEVTIQTETQANATVISRTNFKHMYWSAAQQLTHHAVSGCAMRTGDLFGSGTISGPTADSCGCLLELTWNGRDPLDLGGGITRTFIEDGDTLTLNSWCQGKKYRVGFGSAVGTIRPAI